MERGAALRGPEGRVSRQREQPVQREQQLAYIRDSKSSRVARIERVRWGQAGDAVIGDGS